MPPVKTASEVKPRATYFLLIERRIKGNAPQRMAGESGKAPAVTDMPIKDIGRGGWSASLNIR